MNIDIHGTPVYCVLDILGGIPITESLVVTWVIMAILTGLSIWLTRGLKVWNISKKQAVAEKIVLTAEKFVMTNMGPAFGGYVPLIAAIFSLSAVSSLSALVGVFPPTATLTTELAWSVVVFILITYTKLKHNGLGGYLKGFCDPIFVMAPFNVLGEFFKPVSMAFRHFGNIVSGVVISALIYAALMAANHALFGWLPGALGQVLGAIPFLDVGIPAVVSLYFDWFTSFMQAFIFCMLSMMFISSAAE